MVHFSDRITTTGFNSARMHRWKIIFKPLRYHLISVVYYAAVSFTMGFRSDNKRNRENEFRVPRQLIKINEYLRWHLLHRKIISFLPHLESFTFSHIANVLQKCAKLMELILMQWDICTTMPHSRSTEVMSKYQHERIFTEKRSASQRKEGRENKKKRWRTCSKISVGPSIVLPLLSRELSRRKAYVMCQCHLAAD